MSTRVMSPPPPKLSITTSTSPSDNEHLYKIIEKQRSIIQDLQYSLAKVTAERDVLTAERDVLLKQANQPTSPQASPTDIDLYSSRPLPDEPTTDQNERTPSPTSYSSRVTTTQSPAIMIPSQNTPSSPFTRLTASASSPFDTGDTNADTIHSLSIHPPHQQTTTEHHFGNYYLDDDMHSTTKEPPMDERDIMLYTKYHEAVRSRHVSRPQQSNSALAFITHSPLPPPPQRHGPYPLRKKSAPAAQSHDLLLSNSSFLTGKKSSSELTLSHPPLAQQQQKITVNSNNQQHQQPSYTLRKFIEEDQNPPPPSPTDHLQRSVSTKRSSNFNMVRYEDSYFDPSLEQDTINDKSGQSATATSLSLTDPPRSAGQQQHHQQPTSATTTITTASSPVPMLKDIMVQIISSNMTTNEKGKDIFSFTIAVGKISPTSPQGMDQLWRAEKLFSDFVNLDHLIKSKNPTLANKLCRLPDKSLFVSKAPSKVDERKKSMELYIQRVLTLPLTDMSDVCEFLSTNVLEQQSGPPKRKIGYLTKRGKNFGGWKMRFFVLDGPTVNYYENKGGQYLGTIYLARAQIGSQVVQSGAGDSFRHAFLILEPKKSAPNGIHRHVLCADSDLERDQWVEAMSQYINCDVFGQPPPPTLPTTPTSPDYRQQLNKYLQRSRSDTSSFKKNRKNSAQRHARQRSSLDGADLIVSSAQQQQPQQQQSDPPLLEDDKKIKVAATRNFFSKKMFSGNNNNGASSDNLMQTLPNGALSVDQATELMNSLGDPSKKQSQTTTKDNNNTTGPNQVFGIPLDDAVKVCRVSHDYELPAIVYRCIEYLEAKEAAQEEGIYRLSGSAAKIKKLKEKFNQDGDVRLLELEEYSHEVHAISGLLKMWLRELPGSVLTTELLNNFLRIADIDDRRERTTELGRLVSLLPVSNYTLLRTLSAHLIRIVQNAGVNKMTLRNLGIVFSATLGIPALIFNLFLSEFDYVFWTKQDQDQPIFSPTTTNGKHDKVSRSLSCGTTIMTAAAAATTNKEDNISSLGDTVLSASPFNKISSSPPVIPPMSVHRRNNRNSIHYTDYAPQSIVGLENRSQGFVAIIDEEDEDNTLGLDYEEIMDQQHKQAKSSSNGSSSPAHEYTATVIEPQMK